MQNKEIKWKKETLIIVGYGSSAFENWYTSWKKEMPPSAQEKGYRYTYIQRDNHGWGNDTSNYITQKGSTP